MTLERAVKAKVSNLLKGFDDCWYYMPVPGGYGKPTLDYIVCKSGRFAAIETKAPGKKPTQLQQTTIKAIEEAGGTVFVIDGDLGELWDWLHATH